MLRGSMPVALLLLPALAGCTAEARVCSPDAVIPTAMQVACLVDTMSSSAERVSVAAANAAGKVFSVSVPPGLQLVYLQFPCDGGPMWLNWTSAHGVRGRQLLGDGVPCGDWRLLVSEEAAQGGTEGRPQNVTLVPRP